MVIYTIFRTGSAAIRIAASLNTSVEYLANGAVYNRKKPIETICQHLPKIQEHLEFIKNAVKELQ